MCRGFCGSAEVAGRGTCCHFPSGRWAKQPCAPRASAGQKVPGTSHLHSLTFCVSLWAEARLREETTSGPGCRVSANSRMGSRCSLFAFQRTQGIAVCPSPGETSPPACLPGHATFPLPCLPCSFHLLLEYRLTFFASLLSLHIKPM